MAEQFVSVSGSQEQYAPLAQWLHQLLTVTPQITQTDQIPVGEDVSLLGADYHASFYTQIPDFAMALLKQDLDATTHYAPLLFHLIGCPTCHRGYVEIYDALRVALSDETPPTASILRAPSCAGLAATSSKLLVFLAQLLIGQARSVLRQAHREHSDQDVWARLLLQQAMQISRYIMQGTLRQRALRDLVEVATLYSDMQAERASSDPPTHSYAALVSGTSRTRSRTVRRVETMSRPNEQARIDLRAAFLEGTVTQQDDTLILHLVDLDERLQGKPLLISIALGTLLEPIRWLGGNPYAIRSNGPVAADGTLTTPLGNTELRLSNAEDRNLIEILFKKLEIRPIV
jgi:hypothetical protein